MQTGTSSPELFGDSSAYCVFGAKTLLKRISELESQLEGAKRNQDIEYIHRLRVASRRLRAALSIFEECLPRKQVKTWKVAVKNLTRSCGTARDEDVLITFLEQYLRSLDTRAAAGIQYLIRVQKARRLLMQSDVVKVLDSLQASRTLADLSDTCQTIRSNRKDGNRHVKTLLTYRKARSRILGRLDELLALSRFVHDQNATTKHHELRIAAKRLRYTMEIFSTIYTGGLRDQIELMKQFQDVLGEMHDYYVWSQDLRAHRGEILAEARYGLNKLLVYLGKQRTSRYKDFVSLWDDTKAQGLFDGIREITDIQPNSEVIRELLNSERRTALISDIHGNFEALKAVVSDAQKSELEVFLNAGDAVGFGIYPSQVVQALRSPMFLNVLGNVDLEILEALRLGKSAKGGDTEELTIQELTPSDVAYLQSLPKDLRFEIAGTRVLLTHGSPDSVEEHIYPDSPESRLKEIAARAEADVIVTGHTHLQMNRRVDGVTFVNPGSVGRPVNGEPNAEYAVLSFNPLRVEFRNVSYDVESVADQIRKKGLPESHAQVLLRGVDLKTIENQEQTLARKALWKQRSTMKKVRDVAKSYFPDQSHAEQDKRLALMIFNRTKRMHSLGPTERYWLECAAILHDIGLSRGNKQHHKASMRLVLNDPALPFTQKERYIIGSIARYHRKAPLDKKHYNLIPLNHTEREKVAVLSSILRVADALDYSHRSIVNKVNVKSFPDQMTLECVFSGQHYLEDRAVKKRKNLFERVFKKDIAVVWKPIQHAAHPNVADSSAATPIVPEDPHATT